MRPSSLNALLLLVLATASPAFAAPITNGGFEAGSFAGWSTTGDALVVTSSIGASPAHGTYHALLTTASDFNDFNNFSGTDAVDSAALEAFLGLAPGALGGNEGSAVAQAVTVAAGDQLTFRFNFLTTEGGQDDFAFLTIKDTLSPAGATLVVLASRADATNSSTVVLDPIFLDPTSETGYVSISYLFPTAGTFLVGFGVADAGLTTGGDPDLSIVSGLLVDQVEAGPAATVVPEPATLTLAVASAVCLGGACWWRNRRAATPRPGNQQKS